MSGITAEVPFVVVGNRRGITKHALYESPDLERFVRRFAHCFEWHPLLDILLYLEEGQERTWPAPTFVDRANPSATKETG